MQLYLLRPVWPFKVHWGRPREFWENNIEYPKAAYGRPIAHKRANEAKRAMSFVFQSATLDKTRSMVSFFKSTEGRKGGFWMPSYKQNLRLVSDAQSTDLTVDVVNTGLAGYFGQREGYNHIAFVTRAGLTFAEISSVDEIDSSIERLTLSAPLGADISADNSIISWLLYARFSSDRLRYRHRTDIAVSSDISLIELPAEYAAQETGESPVFLYELVKDDCTFRVTSFGRDIDVGGFPWKAQDINHTGSIVRNRRFFDEGGSLVWNDSDPNFFLREYRNGFPVEKWKVKIYEVFLPTPVLGLPFYVGHFGAVSSSNGVEYKVELSSMRKLNERIIPSMTYARLCPHRIFGPGCDLDEGLFAGAGSVTAFSAQWGNSWIESDEILTAAQAAFGLGKIPSVDDYMPGGEVVVGGRRNDIIAQSGNRVYLLYPNENIEVNDLIQFLPSCNQDFGRCDGFFQNGINFGGDSYAPVFNPQARTLRVNQKLPEGGKK